MNDNTRKAFLDLVSGRKTGVLPAAARTALRVASAPYALAAIARSAAQTSVRSPGQTSTSGSR